MRILPGSQYTFDRFIPIYNWLYPVASGRPVAASDLPRELASLTGIRSRALYVHIPFCETVCTFCPFVRTVGQSREEVQRYVDVLCAEIGLKADLLQPAPVRAIFFGGGTPSILTPEQILQIAAALRSNFDLAAVEEFSFEFEVKSVDAETAQAARSAGVTHARFGLQTFAERYRRLFALTSSTDQILSAADLLKRSFRTASCDLLYGMNDQKPDEFFSDLEQAIALGLPNLDVYPINNMAIQPKLAASFRKLRLPPRSALDKYYMNLMARSLLREHGYLPHNGHGYVRCDESELARDPVVTRSYSFVYHEHVYGYDDCDFIGFGVNAISSTRGLSLNNHASRLRYMKAVEEGRIPADAQSHDAEVDAARPVALKLPYQGSIDRDRVDWDSIPREVAERLDELQGEGLVEDRGGTLRITRDGWKLYANMMFYLSPESERQGLSQAIGTRVARSGRELGNLAAPQLARV